MKRDMNLIREILLHAEEAVGLGDTHVSVAGYTDEQVGYHNYLLIDAGFATGNDITGMESSERECVITGLTWAGHDFLDAAREPERWEKAQAVFGKLGGVSIDVAKSVLTSIMTQQANHFLGTS